MDGKALLRVPEGHPSIILILQRIRIGPKGTAGAKINNFANMKTTEIHTSLEAALFADRIEAARAKPSIEQGLEDLISPDERTPGNGILVAVLDPTWDQLVVFAGSKMFERQNLATLAIRDQAEQWRIRTALEVAIPDLVLDAMLTAARARQDAKPRVLATGAPIPRLGDRRP